MINFFNRGPATPESPRSPLPTRPPIIQESEDHLAWAEDLSTKTLRQNLSSSDSPILKRQLYPFSARMKTSTFQLGIPKGAIFIYARVKLEPAVYPIEVWYCDERASIRTTHYSSDEVEVIPPIPPTIEITDVDFVKRG